MRNQLSKKRFLIVDNEDGFRSSLKATLEAMGHAVDAVGDAFTGTKLTQKAQYDFILVDCLMPMLDGAWFLQNAKVTRSTRVLLMTDNKNRNVIDDMFRLGAYDYMVKPFSDTMLKHHIASRAAAM